MLQRTMKKPGDISHITYHILLHSILHIDKITTENVQNKTLLVLSSAGFFFFFNIIDHICYRIEGYI